jgi:hypothetical protein
LFDMVAGHGSDDEGEDDSSQLPADALLAMLEVEVQGATDTLMNTQKPSITWCFLCGFCAFQRQSDVAHHVASYHRREPHRFCPGGTKQFRLIMALWDNDTVCHGSPSGSYLQRSADLMRSSVQPPLDKSVMGKRADEVMRLLLDVTGPRYVNVESLTDEPFYRRVGNLYYTYDFAHMVFGQAILAASSIHDTVCRVAAKINETGNELASMVPVDKVWWEKMLEDLFFCPFTNDLLNTLLDEAYRHKEQIS